MTTARVSRNWRRGIWAAFFFIISIPLLLRLADLSGWPDLGAPLHPYNPDVWLRLALVRDWLSGADFYDHAVPQTNAPSGGITTHWTRPLDFLLAGLYSLMPSRDMPELRLMLAAAWFPALLSVAAAGLMAAAARRIFNHNHVLACVIVLFFCSPYFGDYFKPGDADHHGLMSVLWCGILVLLARRSLPPRHAFLAGLLTGLIIWISTEGLLIYCATLGVMGVNAFLAAGDDKYRMQAPVYAALGAAAAVTLGLPVEMPTPLILTRVTYDSLSIVHAAVLWIACAAIFATMMLWRKTPHQKTRLGIAAIIGFLGSFCVYALYPKFFLGPMADADPYIFTDFLPVVSEARPLLAASFKHYAPTLLQPLLAALLLFSVFGGRRNAQRKAVLQTLGILLGMMLLLTLVQTRWAYYMAPIAIILCAGLLPTISIAARRFSFAPRRWQPYLVITIMAAYIAGTAAASVKMHQAGTAAGTGCMSEIRYVIQTQQLQKLLGEKSDIFYTYEDVGGEMIFFTPYRIIGSNYHREASGLRDLKEMRMAADIDAFHKLLKKRNVDTLLVCPVYQPRLFKPDAELPDWLLPVEGMRFYQQQGNKPLLLRVMP